MNSQTLVKNLLIGQYKAVPPKPVKDTRQCPFLAVAYFAIPFKL